MFSIYGVHMPSSEHMSGITREGAQEAFPDIQAQAQQSTTMVRLGP